MRKKRIIERECEWTGGNGKHFDTIKYIDVIFYSMEDVKKRDASISYGAIGAVVGGNEISLAISSINSTLKIGQKKVTEQEINEQIEQCAKEIEKNPDMHRWNPPSYS